MIGSRLINVTNNRSLDPTSQLQNFVAAAPHQLDFATGPRSVRAGRCSQVITMRTEDSFGFETNAGVDITVNLTPPVGGQFYSTATCDDGSMTIIIKTSHGLSILYDKTVTMQQEGSIHDYLELEQFIFQELTKMYEEIEKLGCEINLICVSGESIRIKHIEDCRF
jgi:hypothetical protein